MRFRKSIKIMPGVKINLSKSGISTSVGTNGATVNIKPGRKTRATVGIPGTGLSHTQNVSEQKPASQAKGTSAGGGIFVLAVLLVFFFAYLATR